MVAAAAAVVAVVAAGGVHSLFRLFPEALRVFLPSLFFSFVPKKSLSFAFGENDPTTRGSGDLRVTYG